MTGWCLASGDEAEGRKDTVKDGRRGGVGAGGLRSVNVGGGEGGSGVGGLLVGSCRANTGVRSCGANTGVLSSTVSPTDEANPSERSECFLSTDPEYDSWYNSSIIALAESH